MRSIENLLRECYVLAANSPDPSTQNGGILVNDDWQTLVTGINTFPDGFEIKPDRWDRIHKYYYVEHCERNLVYTAARLGIPTEGLTMVVPWAACADCARAIIQSGIKALMRHAKANDPDTTHTRWDDSIAAGDLMMRESGIQIIEVESVPGHTLRRNGILKDTGEL